MASQNGNSYQFEYLQYNWVNRAPAQFLVIDPQVEDYQQLVAGIEPGVELLILEPNRDGVEQITEYLQKASQTKGGWGDSSLHIISHGAPGCVYLGNSTLELDNIERYRHHLLQWQIDNLILYGCSVAAGDVGEEFLTKLHSYIQVNISANPQPTGNAALGGTWNLQQRWGTVGGRVPPIPISLAARAMYSGILGAGDLDTSFGTNGIITTGIGTTNDFGRAIALQPDGKILIAGSTQSGTYNNFAVVRYNSNGTLDTSFNGTGKVVTPTSGSYDEGYGMTLQPDGKIVVVGRAYTGTTWNFSLARYNSNGSLDTSFNGTGIVTTNFGSGNRYAQAVALQSDGKIVVTGYVGSDVAIARYNTNGSLDTSFGSSGTLNSSFGGTEWGEAVAIQPDGKIVIAGRQGNFIVGRYNSNGSLDGSFSTGRISTDFAGSNDEGYAMVLQPDGKIVVAGLANNGSNNDFALARYNTNGTLDTSFNTTGKVTTAIGSSNDQGYGMALQSDGKIVVAGSANNGSNNDFALARYNTNGTLDTSFTSNTTGKTTTAIGSSNDEARGVTLLPNGQILAAGYTNNGSKNNFALVRYGVPDITIGTGAIGSATVNAGTSDYELYQLSFAPTTFSSTYTTPVTLTGVTLTTTGTYTASDISSFKLRYSADATLDAGDATLSTIAPVASGGNLTFSSLSQNINLGSTGYLFVTANIAAAATDNNTIAIAAPTLSNITFLAGSNIGTPTAGNAQAIEVIPTLSNISKTGNEDNNITFTGADFSAGFNDADSLNKIKITSLPTNGTLQLSGGNVTLNQEILFADIPNLTFTPGANFNGSNSFTWNGSDGTNYATSDATANLTITAVNDAPSFSNAGNQTLTTWTNTTQTVSGWANTFVFGPTTDENSQTVFDFLVNVTSGNTLFTTMPDIANNGTLTYTPTGETGSATVQVQLKDNGGVANSGIDTSTAQTFTIIIPPPTVNLTVNTTTGTEAGTTAITLTATAQGVVVGNQTLNLALTGTASNSDFSGTIPAQITIANGSSSGQVTLNIANDLIAEDSETATFTISNPSSGIQLGTTTAQTVTITDDDTAGYDITAISGNTSEFGGQATFDISLTSEPTAPVTLNFTSSDTTESTVIPSVTFDNTNWNQYQTITITGVDDAVADSDITYNITSTATSTDGKYNGNNPANVAVINTDNDIPGVTVIQTGGNTELTEGSITDTYTIQLNTLPTSNVQITATADAETEISLDGVNFAATQVLTFTNANGTTPQTVTVRAIDDTTPEDYHSGGITHTITTSADANYPTTMTVGGVTSHITDNDISYTLTGSSTTVTEGNSGSQQITYNITRAGAINETSSVDFSFSGTATNITDYKLVSVTGTGVTAAGSTITFAPNATISTITVEVLGDQIDEDNETLAINLVNPTATGTPSLIGSPVTTTITDDDTAGVTITPTSGLTTTETGGSSSFDVHLNTQPTANVTINLSSDKPGEGTIDKNSLTFTAANWNTPQTVTITGVDDLVDDGNIAYNIVTAAATSTDSKYNGINADDVAVTNIDNDTAGVTITQTGGNTQLTEGSITDTYTIALNTLPTGNVQITATADAQTQVSLDGVNFAATQTLTFTPTNGITAQTVTVRAIDDNTTENIHSGSITNAITTSADANYPTTITLDGITGNITDNDISYSLTGGTPTITEGNSGSQQLTYNITRAGALNETSSVDFNFSGTATNIADYKLVSVTGTGVSTNNSTITFAPNATSATITAEVLGEQIDEDNETLIFSLVNPTATGTKSVIGSPVTTTITDDDTAGFTVSPTSGLTTTEAGGTTTFTVALNSQPTADVKINLSSSNTAEGILDKPSLTFSAANWNTPQTVTLTGVDDFGDDGDIPYNIITSVATSTDTKYNGINPVDLAVINTDNDTAGVALSSNNVSAYEGGAGGSYTAVLTSKPTAPVTINFSGGRHINRIAALTFNSNNWNVPRSVIITAIDDASAEGMQTETLSHTVTSADAKYNGVTVGAVTATITDNDTAAAPVVQPLGRMDVMENGGEDVYKLFLTTQPTANVNVAIVTDRQTTANVPYLTFTPSDWNIPQLVLVSAVDDNVVEGQHTSNITFVASSADGFYQGLSISGIVANIADNDNVGLVQNLPTPGSVMGTSADDNLVGSAGDDVMNARNGNNRLDGGAGNDVLLGGNGADYITGGLGLDQILSGNGEDYIDGGDGDDVMLAGTGSDRLYGGAGNDKLFGEQGNDYLFGGAGADSLTGGLGRDAFAVGNGMGGMTLEMADVITDFVPGEDVFDLIPALGVEDLIWVQNGANTVIQNVVTSEFLALVQGVDVASLSAVDFV